MSTFYAPVSRVIQDAITTGFPEKNVFDQNVSIVPNISDKPKFNHHCSCTFALQVAHAWEKSRKEIADIISANIPSNAIIDRVTIAPNSYINIFLKPEYVSEYLNKLNQDPRLGVASEVTGKRIIVDFSSPNTAKEMHVGHLRSTIIGDSICRLFEFLGATVLRRNHIGDWGTQFGMLIAYMKKHHAVQIEDLNNLKIADLVAWYKAAKKEFDANEEFKTNARQEVTRLQHGDPIAKHIWENICEISRREYQEIYDLLDVKLEELGESFYNPMLPNILEDLKSKNLLEESMGAYGIRVAVPSKEAGEEHRYYMLQKNDGGYGYNITDLAAIQYRVDIEKGNSIFYVTGAPQADHFDLLFRSARVAGYLPENVEAKHIPFGSVLNENGQIFRTREGKTVRLKDLISQSIDKAREVALTKQKEHQLSEEEITSISRAVGIGALKYADLSNFRVKDYTFNPERMLSFDGNTAIYLLYAFTRSRSITHSVSMEDLKSRHKISVIQPEEIRLAQVLIEFPSALKLFENTLAPHQLATYLYQLASAFSSFYNKCPVIRSEYSESRLLLCHLFEKIISQGLDILGVKTVERM